MEKQYCEHGNLLDCGGCQTEETGSNSALSGGVSDKAASVLLGYIENSNAMDKKTDKEIADLLLEKVWAEYSVDSVEGAILQSAIDRLSR